MPRSHPRYAPEYRQRIIELARAGRSLSELARQFEPTVETIRLWVKRAELDEGLRSDGLTTDEKPGARSIRVLLEEREILKKSVRWCARTSCNRRSPASTTELNLRGGGAKKTELNQGITFEIRADDPLPFKHGRVTRPGS